MERDIGKILKSITDKIEKFWTHNSQRHGLANKPVKWQPLAINKYKLKRTMRCQ